MKHSLERILTVRYKYSQFVGQVFSKLPVDKGSTPCKTMWHVPSNCTLYPSVSHTVLHGVLLYIDQVFISMQPKERGTFNRELFFRWKAIDKVKSKISCHSVLPILWGQHPHLGTLILNLFSYISPIFCDTPITCMKKICWAYPGWVLPVLYQHSSVFLVAVKWEANQIRWAENFILAKERGKRSALLVQDPGGG